MVFFFFNSKEKKTTGKNFQQNNNSSLVFALEDLVCVLHPKGNTCFSSFPSSRKLIVRKEDIIVICFFLVRREIKRK